MSNIIEAHDLTVRYKNATALNDVSLSIPAGVTVGVIGPDGVGKSTLLSLIAGERVMQEGQLSVLGGDIRSNKHRKIICSDVAYMPQGLGKNLYPTLTVEENLQFFAKLFGHSRKQRRARIDNLTKRTGLYPFLSRPAGKLSGGMKQKLGLCCALIHDPRLLILDEPTNGLDPQGIHQIREIIKTIANQGTTILLASHLLDEVEKVCSHVIILRKGENLYSGPVDSMLASHGFFELRSTDLDQLRTLLEKSASFGKIENFNGTLTAYLKEEMDAESLNKMLFEKGITLSHLVKRKESLEEQFLTLTKNQ